MANYFPPSPVYPKNYDSDATLYLVYNTAETVTSLDNLPWAEEIAICPVPASSPEQWATNGFANIDGELFYYDSVGYDENGKINKFKRCSRNLAGTHTKKNIAGSEVRGYVVAEHHNQLVDAVVRLEKFIGYNFTPDKTTLDWRIRNLQALDIIFDDYSCPDITFTFNQIDTNPATGTLIEYSIVVIGVFTSFRLDFGDGSFTTTAAVGTHRYPPNSTIDPIVTVSNASCTVTQTPITRDQVNEPQSQAVTTAFDIPIPVIPQIPFITLPDITVPSVTPQIPPIVFPYLNIGPVGPINVPSIISVIVPPINIPPLISITPVNIPNEITVNDDIPTEINVNEDIPVEITVNDNIPTQINVIEDIPTSIPVIDDIPVNIPIIDDIPTEIPIVDDIPTSIPVIDNIPTSIPVIDNIPTEIPVIDNIPAQIPVIDNIPTQIPVIDDIPTDIPVIDDIPTEIPIIHNIPTDIPVIDDIPTDIPVIDDIPTDIPVIDDIPTEIPVIDDIPPNIFLVDDITPVISLVDDLPPKISLVDDIPPNIPVLDDITPTIIVFDDIPSKITVIIPEIKVDVNVTVPSFTISMVVPSVISLIDDIPTKISIVDDIPDTIQVSDDIPDTINVNEDIPEIIIVADDIPVRINVIDDVPINITLSDDIPNEITVNDDIPEGILVVDDIPYEIYVYDDIPLAIVVVDDLPPFIPIIDNTNLPQQINVNIKGSLPNQIPVIVPTIPPIAFGPVPKIGPVTWADPPKIGPVNVNWGPIPSIPVVFPSNIPVVSCVVTVQCPSATPFLKRPNLFDEENIFKPIEMQAVDVDDIGIPSEILLKVPEIPDVRIIHDIPAIIRVESPLIPDIKIIGPEVPLPSEIRINAENLPSIIELKSSNIPSSIKLEAFNLPSSIKLEVPDIMPKIKIDASEIPDKIQVVGIPSAIELVGAPSEIKLVMPDKPEIELVYKGAPIDVKINLDVSKLTGENGDQPCFALVPCNKPA